MEKLIVVIDPEMDVDDQPALDWAIVRAQGRPVSLELLIVIAPAWAPHGEELLQSATPYSELVERAADIARTRTPETPVSVTVRRGKPAHVTIGVSRRADLLVIGAHPAGRFRGMAHGTLALQVAGRSECPVAVIPGDWSAGRSSVVVGWTDDPTADLALALAATEAATAESSLTIVNCWPEPFGWDGSTAEAVVALVRSLVETAAERTRSEHPGLVVEVDFQIGSPVVAIVEKARRAGLVVVGSHGKGALGSLILGSVSHDVLTNMPAPVIVVPPTGEPISVLPEIADRDDS